MIDEIAHRFRKVYVRGGSVAVTLPPESGLKAGDICEWRIEDGKLTLSKAAINNRDIMVCAGWARND